MRGLLNKVFTPRAIQAQKEMVTAKIVDAVGDFAAPFPVEVITSMLGSPEEDAQQVRHWIDLSLTREIGQLELTEEGTQASIDTAMYYYGLAEERRAEPRDDLLTKLVEAELVREDGKKTRLDDSKSPHSRRCSAEREPKP